ncbi:LETM1-like protein-domain-containing protein [Leucosporidium creatinivorum]|uniref:Mitochondrial proton/calcium exchanger protein n=1 Tax=Leucosporidium creatinivorum TaxID=106004 RepID=A0A1Y2D4M7_9BASI|nr:LETM1-like protein-domain-containing protein [Leucosporidium creatinivorum]
MASATPLRLLSRRTTSLHSLSFSLATRTRTRTRPSLRPFFCPSILNSPRLLHTTQPSLAPTPTPSTPNKSTTLTNSNSTSTEKALTTKEKPKGTRLQRIWAGIKKEAVHYWHGTKLLGKEIRISARIQGRLLAGKKLTRREHRQLKRTTQDLLRLIPFSVFLIVPFMELLLPVALKLFPNMLPSTFTDKFKEDEKKRKLLKVRLEMAKFLQETIRESGIKSPDKIKESEDFKEFFRKVRSTGESPTTDEVVNVSKLFEDDLTLDNLSRPQLVSMCRYMNINAFGTDNFLRYTIRSRMRQIKEDDKVIESEGLSALSLPELQHACQSRGIRTINVAEDHLRSELAQWVELHVNRGLSGTLLILSKAFGFNRGGGEGEGDEIMRSLKDTLASLPDNLVNETELEVSSDSASYKQRLEVLQQQEELIEDEEEQEAKESEARRLKKESEEEAKRVAAEEEKAAAKEKEEKERVEEERKVGEEKTQAEEMLPKEEAKQVITDSTAADAAPEAEPINPEDVRMTSEQVTELGQALEILSAKSSVMKERTELRKLIEENSKAEEEPNPLAKRLKSILTKIDSQLEEYDNSVGSRLNMFEVDYQGRIAVRDLKVALESIAHRPSDEAIEVLLEKLDVDHDSWVPLEDIVSLAEGEGLGIVISEEGAVELAQDVDEAASQFKSVGKGVVEKKSGEEVKKEKEPKLKKEDVVEA